VITRQLMRTARKLEAECWHVLWESVSTGAKADDSSNLRVWAAGFQRVRARSSLVRVLKLAKRLLL
jgi:hypothetical protein